MILNLLKAALEFSLAILKSLTGQCSTFHISIHPSFDSIYAR